MQVKYRNNNVIFLAYVFMFGLSDEAELVNKFFRLKIFIINISVALLELKYLKNELFWSYKPELQTVSFVLYLKKDVIVHELSHTPDL